MNQRLSESELAELERMERAATASPWKVEPVQDASGLSYPTNYETWVFVEPAVCGLWASCGKRLDDADMIAALRNAAPRLLAEVRERREAAKASEDLQTHLDLAWERDAEIEEAVARAEAAEAGRNELRAAADAMAQALETTSYATTVDSIRGLAAAAAYRKIQEPKGGA